uniref:PSII 6.1 kDa protein n=1 Tax=Aureoumbra lagunensis TaxID=44058 RepID=A0A7S3NIS3_9STRA|mmetsp:Transcript_19092/g.24758  ORF Transcript_19092/g.24758 Transcript_19092/m.24758 type:complete len:114 (+) Transcript_19092:56-397(+)|eukprot:CAMPEP_0197290832 /NCGR_PEP_ID=MMETSP0890-20130614/10244_1 /TAXON_ID=44058 ORGANISM="Aureoumbra lagunensis, Strain CCMP1510" /NCGR_SAMPLE_ID=MMETSP0890 /ASSEMBLY_ACC=CAM_ASM_000533 /LENGTH=113 /DNA_ID=CAMNT_0042763159 /DNA_START=50 /DNA_END=391 /DNA_ORIENTATION=-
MRVISLLVALFTSVSALQAPVNQQKPVAPATKVNPTFLVSTGAAVMTAASNVQMAMAGGQSEGMGLTLGIDDPRELVAALAVGTAFWTLYYNWAKDQPDNESDFFGEYDDRRA